MGCRGSLSMDGPEVCGVLPLIRGNTPPNIKSRVSDHAVQAVPWILHLQIR